MFFLSIKIHDIVWYSDTFWILSLAAFRFIDKRLYRCTAARHNWSVVAHFVFLNFSTALRPIFSEKSTQYFWVNLNIFFSFIIWCQVHGSKECEFKWVLYKYFSFCCNGLWIKWVKNTFRLVNGSKTFTPEWIFLFFGVP